MTALIVVKKLPAYAMAAVTLLFLFLGGTGEAAKADGVVNVYYFHNNACESCDEDQKFETLFYDAVGESAKGVVVRIFVYGPMSNTQRLFNELCENAGVPEDKRGRPIVLIGDGYVSGDAISGGLLQLFLAAKAQSVDGEAANGQAQAELAAEPGCSVVALSGEPDELFYFYLPLCSSCDKAKKELERFLADHPAIRLTEVDVSKGENIVEAQKYFLAFGIPEKDAKAPILFFSGGHLLSDDITYDKLVENLPRMNGGFQVVCGSGSGQLSTQGVWVAVVNGLVNGLNPCALSILFLLLSLLLAGGSRSVLKTGFAFLLGKAVAYLLLGTVLYQFLAYFDGVAFRLIVRILDWVLAAAAIILAFLYFIDFLNALKQKYDRVRMQLPKGLRRFNNGLIKKVHEKSKSPYFLLFVLATGAITAVGEFLCTGQVYLATILYVMKNGQAEALFSFGVFTLSMLIIPTAALVAVRKGISTMEVSEIALKWLPVIKLLYCAVFLSFALLILFLK
jgi:sulfite exporter TauE/SafE